MTTATDPKLTTTEVAAQLSITEITVQRWAAAGRFPGAVNLGGRAGWRIPQSGVDQFMREQQAGESA